MADDGGKTGVMAIPEVDVAIEWQAAHAEKAGRPVPGGSCGPSAR